MANGIAGGPATPAMRRQDNTSILGNFLHWMFVGNKPGAGLDAVPGQFLSSIDPRSRAGLLNLASMFTPGGKFDASPQLGEMGMPGQFEPYSVGKAAVGGHLGHDKVPEAFLQALQSGHNQHAHDLLFGGTVHARGAVPKRPAFDAPPTDAAAAIARKLGISPAKVRAQMQAAEQHNTNVAKEQTQGYDAAMARKRAESSLLRKHGIAPNGRSLRRDVLEPHYKDARFSGKPPHTIDPRMFLTRHPAVQAALQRILAKQLFNHRN